MARIKVIHIITRFDKGGSAENTFLTVKGLDKNTYDILLIIGASLESAMEEEERKAALYNLSDAEFSGVRIVTIENLVRNVHPLNDLCTFWTLISIFRKERPHIVHTHTSKAGILGRWAAWLSNVPVIIHTPHGHVFWGYFNKPVSFFYALLEKWTARITDKIITLTVQEKKEHIRLGIAPDEKFEVIFSGADLEPFLNIIVDATELKKKLGIPNRALIIGSSGRLTAIKGYGYLIRAAKKIVSKQPDVHFIFLGDGELLNDLMITAKALGLEHHVHFLGWRKNVAKFMSLFDAFVLPSLNEGMGKVLVEAMALGKPIIASHVGGIIDLVTHTHNGILVPPADSDALEKGIQFLLDHPEERVRMGNEGRIKAKAYDADSMVRMIDHLYRKFA